VNTTAIAYTKIMRLRPIFCPYAITVVFTNVMRLRVLEYSLPKGREILERRRSWPLGMDFPKVNPAFKFPSTLFLFAPDIEISLLG